MLSFMPSAEASPNDLTHSLPKVYILRLALPLTVFSRPLKLHQSFGGPVTNFSALNGYLADAIDASIISEELLSKLIPDGRPLDVESSLWDFKRDLPALGHKPTEEQREEHKAAIADLMKDAVAFYNAHGGYLLFGIGDKGQNRIVGSDVEFDAGDFNNRLEGFTGRGIECLFRKVPLRTGAGERIIGVLLVPQRPVDVEPASFKKSAPKHANGDRAFQANDIYVRIRDQSRPATSDSATWRFLHSARRISGDRQPKLEPSRPLKVRLPARDADLIKFIGREKDLSRLREWLADRLSPVRLLTGIGGLGKTSIAYRFCEELIETSSGAIEQLVWLTAKARTFSALRGKLVEATRTDFSDTNSLYRVILDALGSHPDWDSEDPSSGEVVEAIVEALSIYKSILVIDDIDSLSAEDQREVVYTLSHAVARTVTGVDNPSRILFTSRIDQGFPPSTVIKVDGFERPEFESYVVEVAKALKVDLPASMNFDDFRSSTSGSPLFAASVLRLVRLGTNLSSALMRWKGEEGVEVRRFAFERELQQLPTAAARLLYAVCLLGDTTTLELSQILEVSQPALSSALSSLQSVHLVVTRLESRAGSIIAAPDDVILTRDVLQRHLGQGAKDVEQACAAAQSRAKAGAQDISYGISEVASLWRANENTEALIQAEKLHKRFPENGDVSCLLGTALIRPSVERWHDADVKFALAAKQQCGRPELLEGWLRTKEKVEDWTGLLSLAMKTIPNSRAEDRPLYSFIIATEELIKIARVRGDRARRIALAEQAVAFISRRMRVQQRTHADREYAWNKKLNFARLFLDETTAANPRPGDQIKIFEALVTLTDFDVYISEFVVRGLDGLSNWWSDVERRAYIDDSAKNMLKNSLSKVERMERLMLRVAKEPLADELHRRQLDLAHRAAKILEV